LILASSAVLSLVEVLHAARERLQAGDARSAADIYRQVLDRAPNDPEALVGALNAAIVLGDAGLIDTAREKLEQTYREAGAATQLAVAQTRLQDALRTLEEAAGAVERALALDPDLPDVASAVWQIGYHLGKYPEYFSQFGQDQYLNRHIFKDRRDGVFVDVGAYDGVSGSNTFFFEKFLGWTGLCIEPDPALFARLTAVRSCPCVQTCIADKDGTARFLRVVDGLTMMGGLVGHYDSAVRMMVTERSQTQLVDVATQRLETVLTQYGIAEIDYLSLDTEGSELAILKAFDLSRYDLRALSVEDNKTSDDVRDYLERHGYRRLVKLGADYLYAKI
jgi:FkbM family methyltransferase